MQPERLITVVYNLPSERGGVGPIGEQRLVRTLLEASDLARMGLDDASELTLELQRPELAIEAIARTRRLVLLLYSRLVRFFERLGLPEPIAAYETLKRVLAEDAGLLVATSDEAFAFPHLSFQEYMAACFLADQPQQEMITLASTVWQSDDRER